MSEIWGSVVNHKEKKVSNAKGMLEEEGKQEKKKDRTIKENKQQKNLI